MTEPRLKSGLWVRALIRRCEVQAVTAMVVRKGDETAGNVYVAVNQLDGTARVYNRAFRGDGSKVWMCVTGPEPVPEREANAYVARQQEFDPDIWVVEIEDKQGRHFLDEDVDMGDS